jgi:hypothetical protein
LAGHFRLTSLGGKDLTLEATDGEPDVAARRPTASRVSGRLAVRATAMHATMASVAMKAGESGRSRFWTGTMRPRWWERLECRWRAS